LRAPAPIKVFPRKVATTKVVTRPACAQMKTGLTVIPSDAKYSPPKQLARVCTTASDAAWEVAHIYTHIHI